MSPNFRQSRNSSSSLKLTEESSQLNMALSEGLSDNIGQEELRLALMLGANNAAAQKGGKLTQPGLSCDYRHSIPF